ncbi:pentapeptide repeat-containing protein [Thermodesulfobacteriota bacterium]
MNPDKQLVSKDDKLPLIVPLLVFLEYFLISATLLWGSLNEFFYADDVLWISGEIIGGGPWRLTSHFILHYICEPLFGGNPFGYHMVCLVIHALNAFLVYQVFFLTSSILNFSNNFVFLHFGGVIAGLLFLLSDRKSPEWIAALMLMLVVTFSLCTLVFTLLHLKQRRTLFWVAAMVFYGLGLITHIYSFFLCVLIVLFEIIWRRRQSPDQFDLQGVAWRLLSLAILLGVFLLRYWNDLVHGAGRYFKEMTIPSLVFHYPMYLFRAIQINVGSVINYLFKKNINFIPIPEYSDAGLLEALAILVLSGLFILGVRQIYRRDRAVGIAGVFVLFFLIWNGLSFFQSISSLTFFGWWHFYFNTVGFSLVAAYGIAGGIMKIFGHSCQSVRRPYRTLIVGILVLGLPASLLIGDASCRHRLLYLLNRDLLLQHTFTLNDIIGCNEIEPLTPDLTAQIAKTTKDFSCKNLSKMDLRKADLRGADLSRANLYAVDLRSADLRGASIKGAYLILANLKGADLSGADLTKAFLSGVDFSEADLSRANLSEAILENAILRKANLEYANLSGILRLGGSFFGGAYMPGANFNGANLGGSNLEGLILRNASFTNTIYVNTCNFGGADLSGADLRGLNLDGAAFPNAILVGADLSGTSLKGADLKGADLSGANLKGADLEGAELDGATLEIGLSEFKKKR